MQLVSAGLENHPDGSGNINNIVNGNWNNIEAWFNPAAGYTASQSGTTVTASAAVFGTWDVGSTIRFADGSTDTIATVTDSTHAEVGVSRTIGSQAFYLYNTGEALRGTLLRGLLGVTQLDATAHNDKFVVVNATTEKLEAVDGLSYDGADFLFTEPVTIDDDAGAPSTEAMLTIRRNMTATSGSNWAFISAATVEPAGASTAKSTAGYFTINTAGAGGNITTGGTGIGVNGLYVNPGHSNTTYTLDLLTGLYVLCTHGSGAANLAQMDGITIYMDAAAASTTDLLRALYIPTIQRSGGADAWWAIYQSSTTDPNYLAGAIKIGDSSTVTAGRTVEIVRDWVSNAGYIYGLYLNNETSPTASRTGASYGAYIATKTSSGFNYTIADYGVYAQMIHAGSGTVTSAQGVRGEVVITSGGGAITTAVGGIFMVRSEGTGGVTNAHGLYVETPSTTGGTIATYFGLRIKAGAGTTKWGIYQEGSADDNYFAGRMAIGDNASIGSNYYGIVVDKEVTGTASWSALTLNLLTLTASGTHNQEGYALQTEISLEGTQLYQNAYYGHRVIADHEGSATATTIIGERIYARKNSTGAVTNLYGFRSTVQNNNATGAVTDAYGIYIDAITATGTVTNRWGLYQGGGSDWNYFAGNVLIGTTNKPSSLAKGMVFATGTAATGTVSSGDAALWFDGTNLRLRIGTTDYTLTKT